MKLLEATLPTVAENLALDEALLLEAEAGTGGEVLRLWEWSRLAVVLGSGGVIADDVEEEACRADGVDLWRRSSGGGTVLLGCGCLLYSLVLAYRRSPLLTDIHGSYGYILRTVAESLGLPGIALEGICDLAYSGRKFSGNAQQRKRDHLLHHGTLLYAFDLSQLGRYLKAPSRQPAYREGRTHRAFVMNLDMDGDTLRKRLYSGWQIEGELTAWPEERVRDLVAEKYSLAEWRRRR